MTRIVTNSAMLGGAALALALASGSDAKAQVIGIPSGGSYSPYDSFAERWYDPGDWYGGAANPIGRARDAIRTGRPAAQDPRGLGTEYLPDDPLPGLGTRGDLGRGIGPGYAPTGVGVPPDGPGNRTRAAGPGGMALFQRGYSPYNTWQDSGDDRGFYDSAPARPVDRLGPDLGALPDDAGDVSTRVERSGTAGTGLATSGGGVGVSGRGDTVPRSDRIGRDPMTGPARSPGAGMGTRASELDRIFGRNDYVERGASPNPNYGRGPRYRGYYSDDWYSDDSAFDAWYDGVPSDRRAAPGGDRRPGLDGQPLDRPDATTDAPGGLGEPSPADRPAAGTDLGEPPATLRDPGATGGDRPGGADRPATPRDEPGAGLGEPPATLRDEPGPTESR